jgi:protein required for attachment to host cells
MSTICVVVANQSEAEIYSMQRLRGSLTLLDTLINETGKVRARDLVSDSPGRVHDRVGPGRHGMEPDVGVKEGERRRFAKTVVDYLDAAHQQGSFARLLLVAAPAFLGEIRKAMNSQLAEIIVEEIPKDLVGYESEKIEAHFS